MGLFLSMSGVIGASSDDLLSALQTFAEQQSNVCELAGGTTDDPGVGVITRDGENTTILYPSDFMDWDEASQHLSAALSKPVFSLHIHDGDLWMYVLFNGGKEADAFNPVPEYWQENLPKEEKEKWKGNAELVSQLVPAVSKDGISKYLVEWDLEQEDETKAYPEDEFPICECWQVCDFMKKLGLTYPMGDDGSVLGDTFYLGEKKATTDAPSKQPSPENVEAGKKPWWRFW